MDVKDNKNEKTIFHDHLENEKSNDDNNINNHSVVNSIVDSIDNTIAPFTMPYMTNLAASSQIGNTGGMGTVGDEMTTLKRKDQEENVKEDGNSF